MRMHCMISADARASPPPLPALGAVLHLVDGALSARTPAAEQYEARQPITDLLAGYEGYNVADAQAEADATAAGKPLPPGAEPAAPSTLALAAPAPMPAAPATAPQGASLSAPPASQAGAPALPEVQAPSAFALQAPEGIAGTWQSSSGMVPMPWLQC